MTMVKFLRGVAAAIDGSDECIILYLQFEGCCKLIPAVTVAVSED